MPRKNRTIVQDLSSNNPLPNLAEYWAAGHRVLITKATEATSYTWTQAQALAHTWHGKGGIQGWYAFMRPGTSGYAQADRFWDVVGPEIRNGDIVAADVEAAGVTAYMVNQFIDRVNQRAKKARKHIRGVVYGPPGYLIPNHIRKHGNWRLWEAQYAGHADHVPGWKRWWLWQYTSSAHIAGSPNPVDASRMRRGVLQPTLRRGDNNFAVLDLKVALKHAGYRGMRLNMKFGLGTHRNVRALKKKNGWQVNGLAGPRVWKALGH